MKGQLATSDMWNYKPADGTRERKVSQMASLSKITDGVLTQFKRVMSAAGLDTEMVEGFNMNPEKAATWVAYGRDLLLEKEPVFRGSKLYKRGDGSYGFETERCGLSDDQIVTDFKAAGWKYVHPEIQSDNRIEVLNKPVIDVGVKRMLKVGTVVATDEVWGFQKIVDTIGKSATSFDFEDLRNLVLGQEEELLRLGIPHIVATAVRFGAFNDYHECVVLANLEIRHLSLQSVRIGWGDNIGFGSVSRGK